ncbi:Hypothetical Protein FCC1311_109592 [Hondaea fermentalgiana]|uniref:PX domain-containing protein n=1 Tax=Hondaea fermentalgiana TaxID=2315210 RepID=A0A2R5GV66_9STRA|nr:Hypothetical Protein FCC1311_109592 [Hondaea fermentalgiana]|eukprot:GBG34737.1 Hypothetical Protein FCC1311_109592 [Hondaea fermentalgiana]
MSANEEKPQTAADTAESVSQEQQQQQQQQQVEDVETRMGQLSVGVDPPGALETPEQLQQQQQAQADIRSESSSPVMRQVKCACGVSLEVPSDIFVFKCSACDQLMQIPKPLSDAERSLLAQRALQKWIAREAVSKELDSWLDGKETFAPDSQALVARLYRKMTEFPLFKDKSSGIDEALLQLFKFLPTLEDKLKRMAESRASIRKRFVNYIAGPVFYATFGDEYLSVVFGDSRGEKNDAFKTEIIQLLQEIEKPDGVSTLMEAIESAHSISELPGSFQRMVNAHVESAVANLEHSLAKPRSRSRLKSLYRLVPRQALLKLMKMNVGGAGLVSSAINLFMVRPFGHRSLMQRMASTSLGINESEDLAALASSKLSAEVRARCLAYISHYDGEHLIDMWFATDEEILNFLSDPELTKRWGCPSVPAEQIEALRESCKAYQAAVASKAAQDKRNNFRASSSEFYSGMDDDAESLASSCADDLDDLDAANVDDEMARNELELNEDGSVRESTSSSSLSTAAAAASASSSSSPAKRGSQPKTRPTGFFRKKSQRLTEDADKHPLQYIRMFCYEEMNVQIGDMAIELLGDPALEKFIRIVLPVVQKHMIQSVTSRGSGLIPLMEGLFDAWKRVLKVHSDRGISTKNRRKAYADVVVKIHELIFTLVHNLVRSDKSNTWHELGYWLVDFYNASRLDLDMDSMLKALPKGQQEEIMQESELLRDHQLQNATRPLGSASLPPPDVSASQVLVDRFRERIVDGLFQAQTERSQLSKAAGGLGADHLLPKRLRTTESMVHRSEDLQLTHLEVIYSYEDFSGMAKRGYECVQVDFNISGKSDTKSALWVRRSLPHHSTTADGTELAWMKPITAIRIVEGANPETEAVLRTQGFSKVAKALDKREVYLWYSRSTQDKPIRNLTAIRMDDPNAKLRQQALIASEYILLAPIIRSQKTGGFFSSASKAAIGIYIQR